MLLIEEIETNTYGGDQVTFAVSGDNNGNALGQEVIKHYDDV